MSDWPRATIEDLIKAYKKEPHLYDQKDKLYYNKIARNLSITKILEAVQKSRPETNANEISKKIQTLRTQFGQEVNKIEKSQSLGEDLIYKPKVWWYKHLEWIGDFMKTRVDSTPLSVKAKAAQKVEVTPEEQLFEFADEVDDLVEENYTTEYTISEIDLENESSPPPAKKQKTYPPTKAVRVSQVAEKADNPEIRTIEYTVIDEETQEEIQPELLSKDSQGDHLKVEKFKRRSKAFGKYVAALLIDITDDKIFFDLQKNITHHIHEACVKQNKERKT